MISPVGDMLTTHTHAHTVLQSPHKHTYRHVEGILSDAMSYLTIL
ncbi:unnamed protein product [Tuber aestivum]|uniref:Uncharacterized protein n=1 Tax=Tuber aestivum TaxID=59557 RepID=A0A292PIR0_9PEZI|nr:unnamed protein product [Tuber aestivum]